MCKRTWMVIGVALTLAILVSACGNGELADELTPIPTLPKGEEPTLVVALEGGAGIPAAAEEPSVVLGEELFNSNCAFCHGDTDGAGPALAGIGVNAAARNPAQTAEEYLYEAIVDPSALVVEGFGDIMTQGYGEQFSTVEIDSMVLYILAVSGDEESAGEAVEEPTAEPTEEVSEEPTEEPEDTGPTAEEPSVALGEELFDNNCAFCHGDTDGAGPALTGMGERAATRTPNQTAEEYLHEAIVDPSAIVVEGFSDIMTQGYGEQFSDEELNDLIAYILEQ